MNESNNNRIQDGFSSQQEDIEQITTYRDLKLIKGNSSNREQAKFKISPPQQIKGKQYSLRPDMITGWVPRLSLSSPIALTFQANRYDVMIKKLIKNTNPKIKLSFLGPKYQNTYYAWYDKPFKFPYHHIKPPHNFKFSERQFCGQHWEAQSGLLFDSFYQSANLDSAVQVGQNQYDLFMRVDSNTRGHQQWFNFKIKNLKPHVNYTLNICNFQKRKILYSRSARPYVFSKQKMARQKIGWHQAGDDMTYQKKRCKTYKIVGFEFQKHHRLSFTISTKYQNDEIQLAYCVPYTYTRLNQYIAQKCVSLKKQSSQIVKVSKLCLSLGGLQVPLLTITQAGIAQQMTKKCIIICGRAHPGQSNGSFMIQGFLDFILGPSEKARFLRKHVMFKIVPMVNPDGVVIGNYRTGLSGKDFNRQYKEPDQMVFPEVYAFKNFVIEQKAIYKENLSLFIDFHGHSVKKNTFAYGPQFAISNKFYYECRIFPKLLGNLSSMFRYYSCSFKISEYKSTTARAIFFRKVNIPLSYTIQTSNGFYYDKQKLKDVPYTDVKWKQMGQQIVNSLYEYFSLVIKIQNIRQQKQKAQKAQKAQKNKIKIRRTGRSLSTNKSTTSKQTSLKKNQQNMILSFQDEKITKLFQEIKKADKQIMNNDIRISDDQMSQGSSDGQGQEDDMEIQKINKLYNSIKRNTIKNLDKIKGFSSKKLPTDQDQQEKIIIQSDIKSIKKIHYLSRRILDLSVKKQIKVDNLDKRADSSDLQKINSTDRNFRVPKFSFGLYTPQTTGRNKIFSLQKPIIKQSKINFSQYIVEKTQQHNLSAIVLNKKLLFPKTLYTNFPKQKTKQHPQKQQKRQKLQLIPHYKDISGLIDSPQPIHPIKFKNVRLEFQKKRKVNGENSDYR